MSSLACVRGCHEDKQVQLVVPNSEGDTWGELPTSGGFLCVGRTSPDSFVERRALTIERASLELCSFSHPHLPQKSWRCGQGGKGNLGITLQCMQGEQRRLLLTSEESRVLTEGKQKQSKLDEGTEPRVQFQKQDRKCREFIATD